MRHDLFAFSLNIWDIDSNYFTGGNESMKLKREENFTHSTGHNTKFSRDHASFNLKLPRKNHLFLNTLCKILYNTNKQFSKDCTPLYLTYLDTGQKECHTSIQLLCQECDPMTPVT